MTNLLEKGIDPSTSRMPSECSTNVGVCHVEPRLFVVLHSSIERKGHEFHKRRPDHYKDLIISLLANGPPSHKLIENALRNAVTDRQNKQMHKPR